MVPSPVYTQGEFPGVSIENTHASGGTDRQRGSTSSVAYGATFPKGEGFWYTLFVPSPLGKVADRRADG